MEFLQKDLETMLEGISLFNQGKYWECHEELEHHWLSENENQRFVYWAIIQVAVSLYHFTGGNIVGAKRMIAKAGEKFRKVEEFGLESQVLIEKTNWINLKKKVYNVINDPSELEFQNLLKIKI